MASLILISLLLLFSLFFSTTYALYSSSLIPSSPPNSTNSLESDLSSLKSLCKSTPYPDPCFDSFKLSLLTSPQTFSTFSSNP
ncbi:hypothetical protein OROGR_017885 [Orobanche gracilis]